MIKVSLKYSRQNYSVQISVWFSSVGCLFCDICKQSIPSFQHRISSIFFFCQVLSCSLMVSFLFRKIFLGNLNEAISLAKTDVILKVTSISTNEITSFRFPRKLFRKGKLAFKGKLTLKSRKFTYKSQLAYHLCSFSGMISLKWRHHLTSKQDETLALSLSD